MQRVKVLIKEVHNGFVVRVSTETTADEFVATSKKELISILREFLPEK